MVDVTGIDARGGYVGLTGNKCAGGLKSSRFSDGGDDNFKKRHCSREGESCGR